MPLEKLIIIGSGPAGLTAALYAARAGLSPLVIEGKEPGGQLMGTTFVENWPGTEKIGGPQLMATMRSHAVYFGARLLGREIVSVDFASQPFSLTTNKNELLTAQTVIVATGASARRLNCPGEAEMWGKGVTTCAVCDGALYKGKRVVIVGGGDTAMEDASFMTNFTSDITILQITPALTASKAMQDRVLSHKNIKILYSTRVEAIEHNQKNVTGILITNMQNNEKTVLPADAVFVAIGLVPSTSIFQQKLELSPSGHILQKSNTETSVRGIFAAGDVVDFRYRQAITSAGSGCAAALDAERFLQELIKR